MATQKRRIVYLSDKEWQQAREDAQGMSMSISGYVRAMLFGDLDQPRVSPKMTFVPTAKEAQASRDAILRKINRGG